MPKKRPFSGADPEVITYTPVNCADDKLLTVQNILVALAALIFLAGQFIGALEAYHTAINGFAYLLGAGAYIMEILVLTDRFKRRKHPKELFMPYTFGLLYIVLGVGYFIKHFL